MKRLRNRSEMGGGANLRRCASRPCLQIMILNEQDSGRTIDIKVGNVFTVRLKENPTTGYRWTVETASGLEQIGDHFEAGVAIGAAGVRVFQFRSTRVGSYELLMKNWREWENESSVLARFVVKIIVK